MWGLEAGTMAISFDGQHFALLCADLCSGFLQVTGRAALEPVWRLGHCRLLSHPQGSWVPGSGVQEPHDARPPASSLGGDQLETHQCMQQRSLSPARWAGRASSSQRVNRSCRMPGLARAVGGGGAPGGGNRLTAWPCAPFLGTVACLWMGLSGGRGREGQAESGCYLWLFPRAALTGLKVTPFIL